MISLSVRIASVSGPRQGCRGALRPDGPVETGGRAREERRAAAVQAIVRQLKGARLGAAAAQSISSRRHRVTPFGIEMVRQRRSARETGSGLRPSSSIASQRSMALRTARAPAERMGSGGR